MKAFEVEVDRVVPLLGTDPAWTAWWRSASKAPVLELVLLLVRAPASSRAESAYRYAGLQDHVRRGRKQHLVNMVVSPDRLSGLSPERAAAVALPVVLEGVERAVTKLLRNAGPTPPLPPAVLPAPMSARVLRQERLAELLRLQAAK